MISRRNFIGQTALAGASVLSLSSFIRSNFSGDKLQKFGFISGIIGKELKGDWKEVLKQTTGFGFSEIEIGEFLGNSVTDFVSFCSDIHLKPVAGGIPFTTNPDELNPKLDALLQLGEEFAVVYWPWTGGGPFQLEDCKKSSEMLNKIGELVQKRGMTFCWHNHNKEFIPMEEGLPFDYLMAHTDKKLVHCEMDIYWVAKGEADPLTVLKKYEGRIPILHVKDMAPGSEKDFECPGSGIIDFPSIFAEAHKQGIGHYFVERDNVQDGMACLKTSGAYLKNLVF